MCTAIGLCLNDRFFGRNLDLDRHFGESTVLTPRGYCLPLRHEGSVTIQYALLGMAAVANDFPLYAEAFNERGLAMAGLNFVGNAAFSSKKEQKKQNLTTYELIPWVLGQAGTVKEAGDMLRDVCLCDTPFSEHMPASELHWFLTDGKESLVLESTKKGIRIYEDPLGVLSNNPPFPYQMVRAIPFLKKDQIPTVEKLLQEEDISAQSLGTEPIGLPGDYSSTSRFVRAAALVRSAKTLGEDQADVATCFQILAAVAPVHGSVQSARRSEHYTLYSVVANLSRGEFYRRGVESPETLSIGFSDLPVESAALTVLSIAQLRNVSMKKRL